MCSESIYQHFCRWYIMWQYIIYCGNNTYIHAHHDVTRRRYHLRVYRQYLVYESRTLIKHALYMHWFCLGATLWLICVKYIQHLPINNVASCYHLNSEMQMLAIGARSGWVAIWGAQLFLQNIIDSRTTHWTHVIRNCTISTNIHPDLSTRPLPYHGWSETKTSFIG